jgi:hypothetical protein
MLENVLAIRSRQGDQIGRIFAQYVFVTLDSLLKITEITLIVGPFPKLRFCINCGKTGLGYILGDFLTNSGHHGSRAVVYRVTRLGKFSPIGQMFTLGSV